MQLAVSLNSLGRARYFAGHFEPASAAYQRGLELRRRAGKPWEVATALNNPAMVLTALGQIAQACMVLDECPATDARHQFCA